MPSLASGRRFFRHQQSFHVCGNAKLSCFFDSLGSLGSGRQLFGLFQSLRRPGIPIAAVQTLVRHLFHAVAFSCRSPWLAVEPAPSIRVYGVGGDLRFADIATLGAPQGPVLESGTGRGDALNLHARLAFEATRPRRRARRWGWRLWIGHGCPPLEQAGALPNSLSPGTCRGCGGDWHSMQPPRPDSLFNTAHSRKINGDPANVPWPNGSSLWTPHPPRQVSRRRPQLAHRAGPFL
jgi:hypothetical protein